MRYFLFIFVVICLVIAGIAGCRGDKSRKPPLYVFPDMKRQLKLRPQTANSFFANGLSSQLPPSGTVAQDKPLNVGGKEVFSYEDAPVNTGRIVGTTNFIELSPYPVTGGLLARGQQRFGIYCAPCHGTQGDGKGITQRIGAMAVVGNLHDKRMVSMPDGELFSVISNGRNLMGAYGPQIPVEDRWAIIAYLRALQFSRLGSVDDLPPELRAKLK